MIMFLLLDTQRVHLRHHLILCSYLTQKSCDGESQRQVRLHRQPLTKRAVDWPIYIELGTTMHHPIESIMFIVRYLNLHLYSS